jgi:hypothetical protein
MLESQYYVSSGVDKDSNHAGLAHASGYAVNWCKVGHIIGVTVDSGEAVGAELEMWGLDGKRGVTGLAFWVRKSRLNERHEVLLADTPLAPKSDCPQFARPDPLADGPGFELEEGGGLVDGIKRCHRKTSFDKAQNNNGEACPRYVT